MEESLFGECTCGDSFVDTWDHCVCGKSPLLNSPEEKQYRKDLARFWQKLPMQKEE